jgi:hypothetical protein
MRVAPRFQLTEVALRGEYAGSIAVVRPTLVYGLDDPHNGYGPNRFRRLAAAGEGIVLFGEGEERRDHVAVEDLAELVWSRVRRLIGMANFVSRRRVRHWPAGRRSSDVGQGPAAGHAAQRLSRVQQQRGTARIPVPVQSWQEGLSHACKHADRPHVMAGRSWFRQDDASRTRFRVSAAEKGFDVRCFDSEESRFSAERPEPSCLSRDDELVAKNAAYHRQRPGRRVI